MSEKHLSESGWKAVLSKHKLKDRGLGKALGAYGKCGEKDFAPRLAALDEVEEEAEALQKDKAFKEVKEAADYLDEMLTEAGRSRKAVEAARKKDEAEEEEEEGGADPGAIKKRMTTLLGQVKTKAPEDRPLEFMACVGKGASAVLLGKSAGGLKKLLLELVPGVASPKFFRGECRWEENVHTFVLEKVPAGLSKKLHRALLAETGLKYRVRVRTFDGSFIADSETELEQELPDETVPTPPTPPGADAARAQWLELKARLVPEIKTALAANPGLKETVLKQLGVALGKEKETQFAEALALGQALLQSLAPPTPATPPAPNPAVAVLQAAMAKLLPKVKEAIAAQPERKNELLRPLADFQAQLKAGHAEAAREQFRIAVGLLGKGPSAGPQNLETALAGWQTARQVVVTALTELEKAIRAMKDPEGDAAIILVRAVRANLTERPDTAQKVIELENYLTTDEIIEDAETPNGFGIQVDIRTPLMAALRGIKAKLPAAA